MKNNESDCSKKSIKLIKLIWQCDNCKDIVISRSDKRHKMDFCKCGKSGVDLELWYQRNIGSVIELNREII